MPLYNVEQYVQTDKIVTSNVLLPSNSILFYYDILYRIGRAQILDTHC